MLRIAPYLLALGLATGAVQAQDEPIEVPSGQPVTFLDVIQGEPGVSGLTVRFRFLAPWIARAAGEVDFAAAEADLHWLCETFALARISDLGPKPAQIVISLADRPVEFGAADPDATQFFEAYRPEGDRCVWEGF